MRPANLGFRTDLALLSLAGSDIDDRGDHDIVRTPSNPTFWWGNFLVFRTPFGPGDAAARVELFQRAHPDATHVALGIDTVDGTLGPEDEIVAAGLEVERSAVLTATNLAPLPRVDPDATVRTLASDDDWAQMLALTLTVNERADQPGHLEYASRRNEACRRLCTDGHGAWFGAFDDDRLVASLGIVAAGEGLARYQDVQTHPDARRRGLAGRLVHDAGRHALGPLGAERLVIVADLEGPAIGVYRRAGLADEQIQLHLIRTP